MAADADSIYALEVTPEATLQFILTRGEGEASTPKCSITLKHTGASSGSIAFKVKTTQPRRYLVRPNQGLILPGGSETISILLVDKDKQALLQTYDRLGQSALDHSKDKFLVQSTGVSDEFAAQYGGKDTRGKAVKELADALTSMWNTAGGESSGYPVVHKKLHVKHVVAESAAEATANAGPAAIAKLPPPAAMENMSPEQMFAEVSNLRRKYDELVAFSVNLTAERDILNNSLEQTKRELSREMAQRASLENRATYGGRATAASTAQRQGRKGGFKLGLISVFILCLAAYYMGIKMGLKANGDVKHLPFSFLFGA